MSIDDIAREARITYSGLTFSCQKSADDGLEDIIKGAIISHASQKDAAIKSIIHAGYYMAEYVSDRRRLIWAEAVANYSNPTP